MKLSDFELEVLQVMWRKGPITAPEVHEIIAGRREVAYSTVKTIIDRLEEKQAIHRARKYGRTILYEAVVDEDTTTKPLIHGFIRKLFPGNIRPLFNHVLQEEKLSLEDLSYLEKVLAEKRKDLEDDRG